MHFLEGSHLAYPELNKYCVEYLYNNMCQKNPE